MNVLVGICLMLFGLAAMGFGLLLFYALLPLLYALFGFGVGYWLGVLVTGVPPGGSGWIELLFALGGSLVFAAGAYYLEPFRRGLIGVGLGSLVGGLIAGALGLTGVLGALVMLAGAVIGGMIVMAIFDTFIVVASAFGGAGLAMDGLRVLLPSVGFVDRSMIADGALLPLIVWVAAGAVAMGWQFMNVERWTAGSR